MRITKLEVKGFKSLSDFEISLSQFTCIIGLNGSGKSTLLQFLDFLSQLVRGDMDAWLKSRRWEKYQIPTRLELRRYIVEFTVHLVDNDMTASKWHARYNVHDSRCTYERMTTPSAMFTVENNEFRLSEPVGANVKGPRKKGPDKLRPGVKLYVPKERFEIPFSYQGSILSKLKDNVLRPEIVACREFLKSIYSFDMLSPDSLRRRTRDSTGSIGLGGEKLSAFLHELGRAEQADISVALKRVYKQLDKIATTSLQSGWKDLKIVEHFKKVKLVTEARHISDGMLRLIAIFTELRSEHRFLLFDEIENGVNPELVEFLVGTLLKTDKQVLVSTHSPMILNYLEDDIARDSVLFLYKNMDGETKAHRFFDIPSISEKLEVMGPGEAFVDTDLGKLAREIKSVSGDR